MRALPLILGLLALVAAWFGPLPGLTPQSFIAHMSMHVTVVAVAAPLLASGIAGSRLDPVRAAPGLLPAVPIAMLEMAVVWAWHAPLLHHASRHQGWALALEQGLFLVVGLLVWLSACGGAPAVRRERAATGIIGLLLASMHMTLLGALLALSPRSLYGHAGESAFGFTALQDQQLGGVLMLLVAGTAYMVGGLHLLAGLLRDGAGARKAARRAGS